MTYFAIFSLDLFSLAQLTLPIFKLGSSGRVAIENTANIYICRVASFLCTDIIITNDNQLLT